MFVTLNPIESLCPGRILVVSLEMSTVASWNFPAATRVVSDKLYPLPAEVIESDTISVSDSAAVCGTLTTTSIVVDSSGGRGFVEVGTEIVSGQPSMLLTLMSKMSVVEPVFLMM